MHTAKQVICGLGLSEAEEVLVLWDNLLAGQAVGVWASWHALKLLLVEVWVLELIDSGNIVEDGEILEALVVFGGLVFG